MEENNKFNNYNPDYNNSDEKEKIPEGCAACGGPYPSCKTSCPMFDD